MLNWDKVYFSGFLLLLALIVGCSSKPKPDCDKCWPDYEQCPLECPIGWHSVEGKR